MAAIHLALAFDQNYITQLYVLLTSIFDNNRKHTVTIHAIAAGVGETQKKEIGAYARQHQSEVIFYEVDESHLEGMVLPEAGYISIATYYRFFFPALVPATLEQLIYIDSDIVVIGDLAELYHTNLGTTPVGAVVDKAAKVRPGGRLEADLGIKDPAGYFNAGVLLMNLVAWRKQAISEKAIQFVLSFPGQLPWADQDALNAVLKDNWYRLPGKYNVMYLDIPQKLPREQYQSFLQDKVIIHYTGKDKPWVALNQNKFRYLYYKLLKKSPHATEGRYKDFSLTGSNLRIFLRIRLHEWLYSYPVLNNLLAAKSRRKEKQLGYQWWRTLWQQAVKNDA